MLLYCFYLSELLQLLCSRHLFLFFWTLAIIALHWHLLHIWLCQSCRPDVPVGDWLSHWCPATDLRVLHEKKKKKLQRKCLCCFCWPAYVGRCTWMSVKGASVHLVCAVRYHPAGAPAHAETHLLTRHTPECVINTFFLWWIVCHSHWRKDKSFIL